MKFSPNVTLCSELHPRLYTAIHSLPIRSRAEALRRYAELGLLFETGMLNFNSSNNKNVQTTIADMATPPTNNYDNEIIDIFGMVGDDSSKGDSQ